MRLFVAVTPPPEAIDALERIVASLRPGWSALTWVGRERWHVTLAFLGEVAEDRLDELGTRLARAADRHRATELHVGRGGAFPGAARARVLIAHIGGEPAQLAALRALAASVAAGARRAGAPPPDEGRRYRPHLTLAYSRPPADLSPLVAALAGLRGLDWQAIEVHLIRSHPGPRPRYETIGSWPVHPA